jgi:hypothetical protein
MEMVLGISLLMAQERMVVQGAAVVLGGVEPQMCKLVEQAALETRHQHLRLKVTVEEMEIQTVRLAPMKEEAVVVGPVR